MKDEAIKAWEPVTCKHGSIRFPLFSADPNGRDAYCPVCEVYKLEARVDESKKRVETVERWNENAARLRDEAEAKVARLEVCTRCNGGCPDKEHPVTERWCAECYEHLYKRPIELLQSRLAAVESTFKERADSLLNQNILLSSKLSASEGQLCRVREALETMARKMETSWDLTEYGKGLCREARDALSSTAPCRHEERNAALEKVAEAAKGSIHDCTCKDGITHEYVDGMPVAEIPCPYCWNIRAALKSAEKGEG